MSDDTSTRQPSGELLRLIGDDESKQIPVHQYGAVISDEDVNASKTSILMDIQETIHLSIPVFFSMITWVGMKSTDTALLGHVSLEALEASSLSDLWTMCTGVLVQGRVVGILCGQSVGAGNPKLAGIYLQVSYFVLSILSVFVIFSWNLTPTLLEWFGMNRDTAIVKDAGYYASVLSWSIPGQVATTQLSQFFSSQKIMKPQVVSSAIALVANLVFGYIFVLSSHLGFGFQACPLITTCVVYVQLFAMWFIFCYKQKLHRPCWGGWNWNEITKDRIRTYQVLYLPAAFSLASDFWRMAVIGALAAKIGVSEVAVFNAFYRIIWITLIFVTSVSVAAGINIGLRLGEYDPYGAKQVAHVGIGLCLTSLLLISSILVTSRNLRLVGSIFTSDESLLHLLEDCKYPFIATLFFMNLAVALERIPLSMGRTKAVFWSGFVASWFGQVPGVYFLTKYWRNDLTGLYTGTACGYAMLVIIFVLIIYRSDWEKYSTIAVQRSESTTKK